MNIQMIPLAKLQPTAANPRKNFDEATILGLAQSIKTDGLLQNLVAAKTKGRKRKFPLISGERRYRALSYLVEQGDLPSDLNVPVEVRDGLSDQDALRLATTENVQRENLTPLEEAEAIAVLTKNGEKLEEIIAKTGFSESTIKRRLSLLALSEAVKKKLLDGEITLSQAEVLSLGSHATQDETLPQVLNGWFSTPSEIRDRLVGQLPVKAAAIFSLEQYSGTFTTDLLADDQTTYFDDPEQFYDLQLGAAKHLTAEYEANSDWAELVQGHFDAYAYRDAEDGESGGVVVQLSSNGAVEIHESLVRNQIDASVSDATRSRPRVKYSKPVREYIAMHKSAAAQCELIANPRKGKEVGVAKLFYDVRIYKSVEYFQGREDGASYLEALDLEAAALLEAMVIEVSDEPFWTLLQAARTKATAQALLEPLSDETLDRLFVFLSAIAFGQQEQCELDTNEFSAFNSVCIDLDIDMRKYWIPEDWFLSRRTMAQLAEIISACGLSRLYGNGSGYKKSELVTSMVRYFAKLAGMETLQEDQLRTREWLPEAMEFPAVDPILTSNGSEA